MPGRNCLNGGRTASFRTSIAELLVTDAMANLIQVVGEQIPTGLRQIQHFVMTLQGFVNAFR
jgi:hypothetical protein